MIDRDVPTGERRRNIFVDFVRLRPINPATHTRSCSKKITAGQAGVRTSEPFNVFSRKYNSSVHTILRPAFKYTVPTTTEVEDRHALGAYGMPFRPTRIVYIRGNDNAAFVLLIIVTDANTFDTD